MTAGGLPTPQVLLDDGTGTFPYDITQYARMPEGVAGTRGRQDELSTVSAPQPVLTLDNSDGRFSYGSTLIASPSPILADQKVRVKLTANGTTVNRYTGTLIADTVSWPGGGDEFAIVTVTLADIQAQAERRTLRSVVEEEIMLDSPIGYYTLGEPAGSAASADSSGNQRGALVVTGAASGATLPVTFGSSGGPSTTSLTAASFAGTNGLFLADSAVIGSVGSFTLECFFQTTALSGTIANLGLSNAAFFLHLGASGNLEVGGPPGTALRGSAANVNDGNLHHAAFTYDSTTGNVILYLDGVAQGAPASAGAGLTTAQTLALGSLDAKLSVQVFNGPLSHAALYSSVLSAARIAAHANAGLTGFAGESGTARITRTAGYAGIPLGTLDTSLTNVAFEDIAGKSAMQAIQDVVDAEFGTCYFDGAGALTFHNRNKAVGKTAPDITIDANQLDPGTSFYFDTAGILNYVEVIAQGTQVTQVARNLVSENGAAGSPKHGRYPDSKTYLVKIDAEALDRANWLVSQHGQPAPRAGSLVVDLLTMTAAQQAAWLVVEPDTWVRITGLPAQTHGGQVADLIVQGWGENLFANESDAAWTLALNTSSRPAFFQAWILGDATYGVLGSTTKPYA